MNPTEDNSYWKKCWNVMRKVPSVFGGAPRWARIWTEELSRHTFTFQSETGNGNRERRQLVKSLANASGLGVTSEDSEPSAFWDM